MQVIEHEKTRSLTLPSGRTVEVYRSDAVKTAVSSTWKKLDSERFLYTFTVDTRDKAAIIQITDKDLDDKRHRKPPVRIAEDGEQEADPEAILANIWRPEATTQPAGWFWNHGGAWMDLGELEDPKDTEKAQRARDSVFTVTTDRLPGLIAVNITNDHWGDVAILPGGTPEDMEALRAEHYPETGKVKLRDWGRRLYAIGPTVNRGSTEEDIRKLVTHWANDYGFSFLSPLAAAGADFRATLDKLKPSTDLDKQIVECLRAALQ